MCACLDEAERSSSLIGKYTVRMRSLRHQLRLNLSQVTVKNLRKQARAVLEKRKIPAEVTAELDRLDGHTQVVKPKSPAGTPPSSGLTPPRPPLKTFNSHTHASLQESLAAYWEFESLHPIIIEDLKAFETISSDPAQPSYAISFPSSCTSSTRTAGQIFSITPELPIHTFKYPEQFDGGGESSRNLPSNRTSNRSSPFEGSAQGMHVRHSAGHLVLKESSGPPALHPSWGSFVEHLGF
jgi:hypothetical protein